MTKTIIVPLDGSGFAERALAPARTLARQTEASIVLLMARLGGSCASATPIGVAMFHRASRPTHSKLRRCSESPMR
jgi:nucleotide-binding universal stress UspA family protein